MSDVADPLLDAHDIQGNIIPGFNRMQQLFAAFSATDATRLKRALAALPPLTTLSQVQRQRATRKAALTLGLGRPSTGEFWLNLALSQHATDLLGAAEVRDLDKGFRLGMRAGDPSASTLGNGSPNPSHRDHWLVGATDHPCDILLIFAHDTDVRALAAPVLATFAAHLESEANYVEAGALLPAEIEHFGFRDGISQVGVVGRIVEDGVERDLTTRYGVPDAGIVQYGKPGQALCWPGQFLTGQPNYPGEPVTIPPDLANGSFLVFRRLEQDVRAFVEDTDRMAAELAAQGAGELTGDDMRARIIGREPNGRSLMRDAPPPPTSEPALAMNHFAYVSELPALTLIDGTNVTASVADPDSTRGLRCPTWAHVRKVNPRDIGTDQGPPEQTLGFQMLRRGIPFGPLYDHLHPDAPVNKISRGLLFVAYQRHLEEQFGVLNSDWMNEPDGPTAGGFDLLVGQHLENGLHAPKQATYNAPDRAGIEFSAPRQWVTPTGGAFLFAPSLAFLAKYSA